MIILTYTHRRIDLAHPNPADIVSSDIAHALAAQPCYGGRSRVFYSRAERAIRLADLVLQPEHRLRALLHQAEWAYAPDTSFPDSDRARMRECILAAFDLPPPDLMTQSTLNTALAALTAIESRDLFGVCPETLALVHSAPPRLASVPPGQAEMRYLRLLQEARLTHQDHLAPAGSPSQALLASQGGAQRR